MSVPPLSVRCGNRNFQVTDFQREFWASVNQGTWEEETFRLFDACLTPETIHLDVGTWIGPTLLYAAGIARLSLGFEPDPTAYRALVENVALNPHLGAIRIFPVAIAPEHGQSSMGSKSASPGDSMSSLLFSDCAGSWPVELRRIEEFEHEWPAGARVFLKIDIEGGEYQLLPHLLGFIRRQRPTVYLSLHPHFFMRPYMGHGKFRQARGELALFWSQVRSLAVFREFPYIYRSAGGRLRPADLLHRRCWRWVSGLVLSYEPIAYLDQPPPA